MKKIIPEEVKSVSEYIYQVSGISLNQTKAYLIETRLGALIEQFKCSSYRHLCLMAKGDKTKVLETKIISAVDGDSARTMFGEVVKIYAKKFKSN